MSAHVAIDRIACDGQGLCAELVPELIRLDDWGYPIIDSRPVTGAVADHARRAVAACPKLALTLEARETSPSWRGHSAPSRRDRP